MRSSCPISYIEACSNSGPHRTVGHYDIPEPVHYIWGAWVKMLERDFRLLLAIRSDHSLKGQARRCPNLRGPPEGGSSSLPPEPPRMVKSWPQNRNYCRASGARVTSPNRLAYRRGNSTPRKGRSLSPPPGR